MARVGDWLLGAMLGTGGTANVYRSTHAQTGAPAAVKVLHEGLPADHPIAQRMRVEIDLLQRFDHPVILSCLGAGEFEDRPWCALELCVGGTLADSVVAGRVSNLEIGQIVLEVLDGLGYLHEQGYVHRDVKPDNILIDEHGAARLCDFGIARCPLSGKTVTGDQMGSPSFMPPEQMDDPHNTTAQSDLYALGATLFACVTRSTAFRLLMPESRDGALADVPPALRDVVDFATAHDPRDRFVSARAMADVLADALDML